MWPFNAFKKKPTHSEKVLSAYSAFKGDVVEMLFPNKIHQADIIITSLGKIINVDLDSLDAKGYLELLKIYVDVLTRKVAFPMTDDEIVVSLQMRHPEFVKSPTMAKSILAYVTLNMLNHDFALETQTDYDLLSENIEADTEKAAQPEEIDGIEVGFYFENVMELAIYGKLFGAGRKVLWLSGDAYISQYKKGYQLVEEGKYREAIAVLNASLKVNPIGISARFELCECHLHLNELEKARKLLIDMSTYLLDAKSIAKFYRRMGYIEIENGNNLAAIACYIYSRNFENHPSIEQELQYISAKVGINIRGNMDNPSKILEKYGIPILVERKIDDIQAPE